MANMSFDQETYFPSLVERVMRQIQQRRATGATTGPGELTAGLRAGIQALESRRAQSRQLGLQEKGLEQTGELAEKRLEQEKYLTEKQIALQRESYKAQLEEARRRREDEMRLAQEEKEIAQGQMVGGALGTAAGAAAALLIPGVGPAVGLAMAVFGGQALGGLGGLVRSK